MQDWHPIKTQEDIEHLMSAYGDFHDSCIVSLDFQSGAYVDDDRSRLPERSKRQAKMEALLLQCFFFYCKGLPSPLLFWYTEL